MHIPIDVESLVEMHDQPFVIIDGNKRILVINQAYAEAFNVDPKNVVGRRCHTLLCRQGMASCPCGDQGLSCPFQKVFEGHATRSEGCRSFDMEGREHRLSIQAYPIHTGSGQVYVGELIQRDAARFHPSSDNSVYAEGDLVGSSPIFMKTLKRLQMAGGSDAPVLLLGETGTGKELAAAYVHRQSRRREKPFLTLDCTALTQDLFESEVFGHEKGAFTGSTGGKRGLYELADKGTLFLDEVGEMALPLQAKLLRILETGQFRRLGGNQTRRADVRIICATNRELRDVPWFRADLYYRIACVSVRLPRLADRLDDIPALVNVLLKRIARSSGHTLRLDEDALHQLQNYSYPGNVRELRNILWVAAVNSEEGRITARHIREALPETRTALGPGHLTEGEGQMADRPQEDLPVSRGSSSELERLARVLRRHQGNRRLVAEELAVSERTLYRKLRRFGLS